MTAKHYDIAPVKASDFLRLFFHVIHPFNEEFTNTAFLATWLPLEQLEGLDTLQKLLKIWYEGVPWVRFE